MSGHPLYWLAFLTFILVLGFAAWNLISTRRQQKHGHVSSGPGSSSDPMR